MQSASIKGVSFDKSKGKWKARTQRDGKTVHIGHFATQLEAAAAVEQANYLASVAETTNLQPVLPVDHEAIVARAQRTKLVAQHNTLVETPTTTTLLEAKIFALMLRCIRKGDLEAPTAVIPLSELFPSYGGRQHELLEAAMLRMMSATIRVPELNEEAVHLVSLCDSMRYDPETKLLVATFGKAVTPYLINLVGNFTTADVDELLAIKSNSTHTLYWLMRSWQFKSPHTVSVDELRELTMPKKNQYERYSDFRSKVLQPSVAELNELSFDITYTERRQRGKAVTYITFNIGKKPQPVKQLELSLESSAVVRPTLVIALTPLQQKVQTRLQKLKLTEAQIHKVLQVVTTDMELTKLLKETYPILRDFETKAKPGENVAAATMALLKSTFPAIWAAN
jgi:plasmid replication initiation protein